MTTATEKKANAAEQQEALSKLPIPHVNPKQVDKAAKALEKVADKGKAVPGDQPKSVKVVNASQSGTNGTKAKKTMTVEEAVDKIKSDLKIPKAGDGFQPSGGLSFNYHTRDEMAALKTPWVMVKGVLVEPLQTNIPDTYRISTESGHTFWQNRPPEPATNREGRTFSHYTVDVDGVVIQFLLDDKSSVEIQGGPARRNLRSPYDRGSSAANQVVLINSDSRHDSFFGDVCLEGQSTSHCTFAASTISNRTRAADLKAPWLTNDGDGARKKLQWAHVTNSTAFNSTFGGAIMIRHCAIDNSTIKVTEEFRAESSTIKDSTIKGNNATLKYARLERTYIPSTGAVMIVNTQMTDESLGDRPVYLPNKFSSMKIDLPHDHMFMRRESVKKIVIGAGYHKPVELDIDASMDEIDAGVREVLRTGGYHNPLDPDMKDPVVGNLIHYVVQSLRSRLRVIKMLDSTVRTARVVTGEVYRENYEDDFGRPF